MKDLSIDNITQNAILVNSLSGNARLTFLFERLTTHLHAFARETRLSTEEWSAGLKFLEEVGQKCKEREVCFAHRLRFRPALTAATGVYLTFG